MGAVAAILVGAFAFIVMRLSQPVMAPLYMDLSQADAASIIQELDSLNVPYVLKNGGGTVEVPNDQVLKLRMQLAGQGIPTGGSVGYEIFDKASSLGTTNFVQNINHLRALEGELARSIRTISRVTSVRVHLVVPERQLFQKDRSEPSASIVIKLRGQLESGQIRAIQHLVASAVDGLKPERVAIVDEAGRLLASGNASGSEAMIASSLDERSIAFQKRMQQDLDDIVSSVVGPGRARIQVNAELDFNRVTRTADVFNPDGQVVRSSQTKSDQSTTRTQRGGAVSVGNSLPDGGAAGADGGNGGEHQQNTEETTNYEISRTTTTEVVEPGRLKKVSVAVLVDGVYAKAANGELQYQPRGQEELDRIGALVRSAVGFDKSRGDTVEVVNLRFAEGPRTDALPTEGDTGVLGLDKADYFYLAELGLSVVLGLLIIFLVVRPLIRRIIAPEGATALLTTGEGGPVALLPDGRQVPAGNALVPAGSAPSTTAAAAAAFQALPPTETQIQIEKALQSGALHSDTINRVGTLIEESPSEAVAIVRSWLADAA